MAPDDWVAADRSLSFREAPSRSHDRMPARRALLFSYHFPPGTAAGAQRWDVFTRAGVERGWTFDVITAAKVDAAPANAPIRAHCVPHRPHWLNRSIDAFVARRTAGRKPAGATNGAATTPATDSAAIGDQVMGKDEVRFPRTRDDLRRNVRAGLLHLSWVPWMQDATAAGKALLRTNRYDVVLSSGPPHLGAEAARRTARAANVPLVVDFRDPWSLIDVLPHWYASWAYYALAERYERRSVAAARLAVMNTTRATAAMRARYPHADLVTVPNGFNGETPVAQHDPSRFLMVFAGNIYLDRDPRPLLAAVSQVARELRLTPDAFTLRFIGGELAYGGRSVTTLATDAGIPDGLVEARGAMPRRALFTEMAAAAMLVNLPQGAQLCIPSKVYEYLHFPAWVLGLEPEGSATHDVLQAVGADLAPPTDVAAIAAHLRTRVLAYRAGHRPVPLAAPDEYSSPIEGHRFFDAVEARVSVSPR